MTVLLIDLYTQEGIVGRSYVGPYLKAARYIIPAIRDLASALTGKPRFRRWRTFSSIGGRSISVAMKAPRLCAVSASTWRPGTRSPKPRKCRSQSCSAESSGPVPAYNSNGLWLRPVDALAKKRASLWRRAASRL